MKSGFLKNEKPQETISNEEGFNQVRALMQKSFEDAQGSSKNEDKFYDQFNYLRESALNGSLIAQDYLGYAFKKGIGQLVKENYELSQQWLFLSGSNGNDFTINRLKIFFARSYDQVFNMPNCAEILEKNDIYRENYEIVLGKLFCDAFVDILGISAQKLFEVKPDYQPATIPLSYKYEEYRKQSAERVVDYLQKTVK